LQKKIFICITDDKRLFVSFVSLRQFLENGMF